MNRLGRVLIQTAALAVVMLFVGASMAAAGNCAAEYGNGSSRFSLATGSPGELGLIEALANAFNQKNGTTMCWQKAGSGESFDLLKKKEADLVMVHAPAAEKKSIEEGWAIKRTLIGSNEFFIVGPTADPAGIAQAKSAADAYAKIAGAGAKFFSRGDNSGTHKKEISIWEKTGISPSGAWYIVTKDFMLATLKRADLEKGYFMVDSSSWVAAKSQIKDLKVLFKGDPVLINVYHALCQPDGATPGQAVASKFIDFASSEEGQKIIREYGTDLYGEPIYNDAAYAKQYDH